MKGKAMDFYSDCFVTGVLATVLRLTRLSGIAPLHFEKESRGWRIRSSKRWAKFGYVIFAILQIAYINAISFKFEFQRSFYRQDKKRRITWFIDQTLTTIISSIAIWEAPRQMPFMIAFFNKLQKINFNSRSQLSTIRKEAQKFNFFVTWVLITLFVIVGDFVTTLCYDEAWGVITYLYTYLCIWILQMRKLQFIIITLNIKESFEEINIKLKSLLHEDSEECIVSPHEIVRRLSTEHATACDVLREVNRCHGLILFLSLCSLSEHLIGCGYFIIDDLIADDTTLSVGQYVVMVGLEAMWGLFYGFVLIAIIEPCHLTHMEIEVTQKQLCHLMRRAHSTYEPLAVELELFYYQLILNQVSFKPLQVFTLSRSLVVTILGNILKYLVILIQL